MTPNDTRNAKRDPNSAKDPDGWVSYLKTLAEEAHEPDAFSERLTKAEASKRIDVLKAKLKLFDGPPHAA